MDNSMKYQFLMSQLKPLQEIKDTEKTKLSIVFYEQIQSACVLRVCKNRDLSSVCESLRKLRNPNAAVVYDYVYLDGNTYILEENLTGKTIQEYLDEGREFSEKEAAQIAVAVCKALEELHEENPPVVHNDINPSNIMLREDGGIKLFDFDISRLYKQGADQNTMLFGTEEYAAPEHYGYGQSEPRTDIYCLGATLHKMLTGKVLSPEHRITYKGGLQKVLEQCLQFDPENRYATAKALRKDLERFLSGKRKSFLWIFVSIAAIFLLLLGGCIWKQGTESLPAQPNKTSPALQETQPIQTTVMQEAQTPETTLPQEPEDTTPPSQSESPEDTTPPPNQGEAQQPEPSEPPKDPVEDTPPPNQTQTPGGNSTPPSQNEGPAENTTPPQTDENQETPVTPPQNEEPPVKNDTRENADLLQLGQTYSETIEEDSVPEWYRFITEPELSVYRIYVDCGVQNPVNGRTVVQLYDSNGADIKKLTLDYRKADFVDILLEPDGEYAIKITGENTVPAVGDYKLQVTKRRCDAGTDKASATVLTLNTQHTAKVDSTLEDYYIFTAEQAGKYKIEVHNKNVGAQICYWGERRGGSVFSGWANNEAATNRIFQAQAGDVIYIQVDADDFAADGDYTLLISLL